MKPKIYPCIAAGRDEDVELIPEIREALNRSQLRPFIAGEFVQVNIGFGGGPDDPHLFRRTAEEILEALPRHPEAKRHLPYRGGGRLGFRGVTDMLLERGENVVGAYIDYEPGQGIPGQSVARDRFDTGVRAGMYRPGEVDLAVRCMGQMRSSAYALGLGDIKCGFYNTPAGLGDRANARALQGLHSASRTDFVFANSNQPRDPLKEMSFHKQQIKLRRKQFEPLGERAPEVIVFIMPRDNSRDTEFDFALRWVSSRNMTAKGRAIKHEEVSAVYWINSSWIRNKPENKKAIVSLANSLARGLW